MSETTGIVFIKDLELVMSIGIHDHEKKNRQRVIVNAELKVTTGAASSDRINDAVSYEDVIKQITGIAQQRHYNLVETVAEAMAAKCLEDKRIHSVKLKVEKPDIFAKAASVGIEIERQNS